MNEALVAAALVAALAIALEWRGRHPLFYLLKPLATLLVLAAVSLAPTAADADYSHWLLAALLLCLAGDIALMFEGLPAFALGLSAFLCAHALFIVAFLRHSPLHWPPLWAALALLLPVALLSWTLLQRAGRLAPAVLLYQLLLLAMLASAWMHWLAHPGAGAGAALAGALLFLVSDALLGWRQFIGSFLLAQPLILSTYWLAIGLIACSV